MTVTWDGAYYYSTTGTQFGTSVMRVLLPFPSDELDLQSMLIFSNLTVAVSKVLRQPPPGGAAVEHKHCRHNTAISVAQYSAEIRSALVGENQILRRLVGAYAFSVSAQCRGRVATVQHS